MTSFPPQGQPPFGFPNATPLPPGVPMLPEKKTRWPLVIGIIAIIFGAMGVLGSLTGLAGVNFSASPDPAMNKWAQQLRPPPAISLAGALVAAILLLAGIMLVKRRRIARRLFLVYAAIDFVTVCFSSYWTFGRMSEFPMPASMPANLPPGAANVMNASMRVATIFGFVLVLAICTFVVIWFLRPKIKQEISRWP